MGSSSVLVIINPVSGNGGRADIARRRVDQAEAALARHGAEGEIVLTAHVGHARDLAAAAAARGVQTVIAWGGDGTVNEVASALAFGSAALAIVPAGSGNGLARELRIPFDPAAALAVALGGATRLIDAGEFDGRLFVNVAGVGLDARVAHRFADGGPGRRGFARYAAITLDELFRFVPERLTISVDGAVIEQPTMLVAVANARQYGNGAIIAPQADLDDGRLDLVVVGARPALAAVAQLPFLFTGWVRKMPGVTIRSGIEMEIASELPIMYHVDGEPFVGGEVVRARVRPGALRMRVSSEEERRKKKKEGEKVERRR